MDDNFKNEISSENNADEFIAEEIVVETKAEKTPFLKRFSKKQLIIAGVIAAFIIAAISILLFFIFEITGKTLKEPVSFDIAKGSPSITIANTLKENDVIGSATLFRFYCRLNNFDSQFKYGNYTFEGKNSYLDICNTLMTEGATAKSVMVTIPEGTSIYDYTKDVNGSDVTVPGIATLLEKAGVCTKKDFFAALEKVSFDTKLLYPIDKQKTYVPLEGYLFPDTYDFFCYDSSECATLAVEKMLKQSENKITDEMHKRAEKLGYSMNEILTLASIIQLESGQNTAEMPNVAGVFYNRLKQGGTLGSSPTCYYGNAFENDDGRYDTYKVIGLPPGPLCAPGIDAINAVLWPTENSPYFYFVTDKNGKFYYHKTFAEQEATVNRLKNEGNWIYEYLN